MQRILMIDIAGFVLSFECFYCFDSCLICASNSECSICKKEYVLQQDLSCLKCYTSCATCSIGQNSMACLTCNSGYFLHEGNQCIQTCPDTFFIDYSNQKCSKCSSQCLNCITISTQCTTCPSNTVYFSQNNPYGQCLQTCPEGYAKNSNYICQPCQSACKTCQDLTIFNCQSCSAGYWFSDGNTCLTQCKSNQFQQDSDRTCQYCHSSCLSCSGGLETQCLTCQPTKVRKNVDFLSSCIEACLDGTYADGSRICQPCDSFCSLCKDGTKINCQGCNNNYFLFQTSCIEACPTSYYPDTSLNQCLPCFETCQDCAGPLQGQCTTCKTNYFRRFSGVNSECVQKCDSNYYLAENVCLRCYSSCLECKGPTQIECLSCPIELYYFYSSNNQNLECLPECPQGFALNNEKTCLHCHSYCLICSDLTNLQCSKCSPGFVQFQATQCLVQCPDGYWANYTDYTCRSCDTVCLTCDGPTVLDCINYPPDRLKYTAESKTTCLLSCPDGYASDNQQTCQICNQACALCNDLTNEKCSQCNTGNFLMGTACNPSCPDGYFSNSITNKCQICDSACRLCSGPSYQDCLSCSSFKVGNLLTNGIYECLDSCPEGKAFDLNKICQPCDSSCEVCASLDSEHCSRCSPGNFLFGTKCLFSCPTAGYYENPGLRTCSPCDISCYDCSGPTNSNCHSCNKDYVKNIDTLTSLSQCWKECPGERALEKNLRKCLQCDVACLTCNDLTNLNCPTCNTGYYKNQLTQCVAVCPDNTYPDQTMWQCQQCSPLCWKCTGSTEFDCTSCYAGTYLQVKPSFGKSCQLSCDTGYAIDTATLLCEPCNVACTSCSDLTSLKCQTCSSGYYKYLFTQCVQTCPDHTFPDTADMQCQNCSPYCWKCGGPTEFDCAACQDGTYLQEVPTIGTSCVSSCSAGYALNSVTKRCDSCNVACSACADLTNLHCSACKPGYYLYLSSQCLQTCPTGYFINTVKQICQECNSNCKTCFGAANSECYECNPSYAILTISASVVQCLLTCPIGYAMNPTTLHCEVCNVACKICDDLTNLHCKQCSTNFYLYNSEQCLEVCPGNYFSNVESGTCELCSTSCSTCCGPSDLECLTCSNNYFSYTVPDIGNLCIQDCFEGYTKNYLKQSCDPCDAACVTCGDLTRNACASCNNNYFHHQTSCLDICPDGFYGNADLNQCLECNTACGTCSGPSISDCLSCSELKLTFKGPPLQCVDTCPLGYTGNTAHQCQLCHMACAQCLDLTNLRCAVCAQSYFQYQATICSLTCPDGFYGEISNYQCMPCHTTCLTCTGASNTQCKTCVSYLLLQVIVNGIQCQTECNTGYVADESTMICRKCHNFCTTCKGFDNLNCQSCSSGYFLYSQQCLESCPKGYFSNSVANKCDLCQNECSSCTGLLPSQCTECSTSVLTYLNGNERFCLNVCPAGYASDSNKQCQKCDPACRLCSDLTHQKCQACSEGYFAFQSTSCLATCPQGYYNDLSSMNCNLCYLSCFSCTGPSDLQCIICKPGYLYDYFDMDTEIFTSCVTECRPGYALNVNTQECKQCYSSCSTCSGLLSSECLTCEVGYFLFASACSINCPDSYYADSDTQTCIKCSSKCFRCEGPTELDCLDCANGKLEQLQNSQLYCVDACYDGFSVLAGTQKCVPCDKACLTCQDQTTQKCPTCSPGYFKIHDTFCVDQCDPLYFADIVTKICYQCHSTCLSCNGTAENDCLTCDLTKYFFFQDENTLKISCLSECPIGFAKNLLSKHCEKCISECTICQDLTNTNCQACSQNFYLYQLRCLSVCPQQYYQEQTQRICANCDSSCLSCFGPGPLDCSSCSSSTYLFLGASGKKECLQQCPKGYASDSNKQCHICNDACSECSDLTNANCAVCSPTYYKYLTLTCLASCPVGFYEEDSTFTCDPCHSSCVDCFGPTQQNCTSCPTGHFKYYWDTNLPTFECVITCPIGYYQNSLSVCQLCHQTCSLCFDLTSQGCTKCSTEFFLYQSTCLLECPQGFYKEPQLQQCQPCHSTCLTCDNPLVNDCLLCQPQLFYFPLQPSHYSCFIACPTGYASDQYLNCKPCHEACQQCNDLTYQNCSKCASNYFHYQSLQCLLGCPQRFFKNVVAFTCDSCDITCLSCAGPDSNQCISCENSLYFFRNTANSSGLCLQTCPKGYATDLQYICQQCVSQCRECGDLTIFNCGSCNSGFYLFEKQCRAICPDGFYANIVSSTCDVCDESCKTCTQGLPHNCISCPSELVQYNNITGRYCLPQCPSGFASDSLQICELCDSRCQVCADLTNTHCSQCADPAFQYQTSICLLTCPDGFYANSTTKRCESCDFTCKTCLSYTNFDCTLCFSSNFIYYTTQNDRFQCLGSCPVGFQPDTHSICQRCFASCESCLDLTQFSCLTCQPNYFLDQTLKSCNTECPLGFFPDIGTRKCLSCDSTCLSCYSYQSDNCIDCPANRIYYYFNQKTQCLQACPNGFASMLLDTKNVCVKCHPACMLCLDNTNVTCQECVTGYFLYGTKCLSDCPTGFFKNYSQKTCDSCYQSCYTCFGPSNIDCLSCPATDYYSYVEDGMLSCLTECPYGWIQDANKNCTHCIKNCETCLDLTNSNCPKCAATYFRYETSFCLEICPTKYFGNTSNYVCEPCDVSCQECTGASSSECTTCAPSFYTFDEPPKIMCYLECPGAYFGNLNWICQDCHFSCSICDGPLNSNCSQCSSDYFLFNHTTCLRDCPEGFYKNSQTKTCDNCDVSCKSCNGPLTQNCLSCPSEKYLLTDEFNNLYCLNQCPLGKASNSQKQCLDCDPRCKTCLDLTNLQCPICEAGVFRLLTTQCVVDCPSNYFTNTQSYECSLCDITCLTCSGAMSYHCSSCSVNRFYYFLPNGIQCLEKCPQGYSPDHDRICQKCHPNCQVCNDLTNLNCSVCAVPFVFFGGAQCLAVCPDGFAAINFLCVSCFNNCLTCFGNQQGECISCKAEFYYFSNQCLAKCPLQTYHFRSSQLIQGSCVYQCQGGLLADEKTQFCQSHCSDGLFQLENTGLCLNCSEYSFVLRSSLDQCSLRCQDNEFYQFDLSYNVLATCIKCSISCLSCFGSSSSQCLSCVKPYLLLNTSCIMQCPFGYFYDATLNYCFKCNPTCLTCVDDSGYCLSCSSLYKYTLRQGEKYLCLSGCPVGYTAGSTCSSDQIECMASLERSLVYDTMLQYHCNSDQLCQSCSYNTCVQCVIGSYLGTNYICKRCYPGCSRCTDDTIQGCLECSELFDFQNFKALSPSAFCSKRDSSAPKAYYRVFFNQVFLPKTTSIQDIQLGNYEFCNSAILPSMYTSYGCSTKNITISTVATRGYQLCLMMTIFSQFQPQKYDIATVNQYLIDSFAMLGLKADIHRTLNVTNILDFCTQWHCNYYIPFDVQGLSVLGFKFYQISMFYSPIFNIQSLNSTICNKNYCDCSVITTIESDFQSFVTQLLKEVQIQNDKKNYYFVAQLCGTIQGIMSSENYVLVKEQIDDEFLAVIDFNSNTPESSIISIRGKTNSENQAIKTNKNYQNRYDSYQVIDFQMFYVLQS